ncbi:MAG: hypothetical protein ABEL76_00395 [Bradymonadaceae bacterium]
MPTKPAARAYFGQAREDLAAAKAVAASGEAPSTFCMLLQMVFEKITKAALLEAGFWTWEKAASTHVALKSNPGTRLLGTLKRNAKILGIPAYRWDYLSLKLRELEDRHPQVYRDRARESERGNAFARHGQLEYPWKEEGEVRYPAGDLNLAKELRDPEQRWGAELLDLASTLIERFDEIFA